MNQGSLEEQKLYNDYILIEYLLYEIRRVHSDMAIGNQDLSSWLSYTREAEKPVVVHSRSLNDSVVTIW